MGKYNLIYLFLCANAVHNVWLVYPEIVLGKAKYNFLLVCNIIICSAPCPASVLNSVLLSQFANHLILRCDTNVLEVKLCGIRMRVPTKVYATTTSSTLNCLLRTCAMEQPASHVNSVRPGRLHGVCVLTGSVQPSTQFK